MRGKSRFRVGQRAQLASDPTHTFVIDRSLVPERIYREKGSGQWWTKSELRRLGAPEILPRVSVLTGREMRAEYVLQPRSRVSIFPGTKDATVSRMRRAL